MAAVLFHPWCVTKLLNDNHYLFVVILAGFSFLLYAVTNNFKSFVSFLILNGRYFQYCYNIPFFVFSSDSLFMLTGSGPPFANKGIVDCFHAIIHCPNSFFFLAQTCTVPIILNQNPTYLYMDAYMYSNKKNIKNPSILYAMCRSSLRGWVTIGSDNGLPNRYRNQRWTLMKIFQLNFISNSEVFFHSFKKINIKMSSQNGGNFARTSMR